MLWPHITPQIGFSQRLYFGDMITLQGGNSSSLRRLLSYQSLRRTRLPFPCEHLESSEKGKYWINDVIQNA
jgi:hypothetical protein